MGAQWKAKGKAQYPQLVIEFYWITLKINKHL